MVSGTAAVSFVGQAFEPDVLALRGQLAQTGKPDDGQTEGLAGFVPLEKGDHRGSSELNSRPPAAKSAAKLSQSFDSLAKGDKEAFTSSPQV
jgi:hypothetical protein